ncbi:MAG: pyridoxal-dependent decarboxylase [Pseudomonadota bacterium]
MAKPSHPNMTAEEFRKWGHAAVDWVADYLADVENNPVLAQVEPGDIRSRLPARAPQKGEDFAAILADLDSIVMPGVTHWQSPNFFAYFPANNSGPSIIGELISAGLGVQGMLWQTSPACTEIEIQVLDWLVEALDLPARFSSSGAGGGVIQDSASSAALCALLAARRRIQGESATVLPSDPRLVAYTSSQAHSSMEKAMMISGLGSAALRPIEVDENFSMRADRLARQIEEDRAAGLQPFFISATVGTTSSLAFDPVALIAEIAQRYGLWLHVDAAMAGTATICPEFRWLNDGIEHADSYCFNPHKWMLTNFDCDCFYVADRQDLISALSVTPEYLRNQASDAGVTDFRDWQIPLGRRFRALKLWFVLRHYGIEGIQSVIRNHIDLTKEMGKWVAGDNRFELLSEPTLNLLCFRLAASDEVNQELLNSLNASGELYLSHTVLDEKYYLRFCVGQGTTERVHVERAWQLILRFAGELTK